MRIGIEVQRLFRPNKHGMEIVALELIRQLQKIDKENDYFIFVKDDRDECIQETANFKIVKVNGFSYADWEQVFLPMAVRKYNIELLHCTCNTAPLKIRIPFIVTLHDIIFLESVNFKGTAYQNIGNLYRKLVVPQILNRSEAIITVSKFEKENILKKINIEAEKVTVVYNAVNGQFKKIDDRTQLERVKRKYELPENFILFFGNKAAKKNSENVIRGYVNYVERAESDVMPLVVTDVNSNYIQGILRKYKLQDFGQYIFVRSYIPFEQLPLVYNLAKLFLYPSLRESFGMPILESMASGTPVITSNTSSMPEVSANCAILVNPDNFKEIGEKINYLLNRPTLMQGLVEKGMARAREFSWERTARQMLNIYKEIY